MDNMGAGGGSRMESNPFSGAPENMSNTPNPMGEVADFNEFLAKNEYLKPQMEQPAEMSGKSTYISHNFNIF